MNQGKGAEGNTGQIQGKEVEEETPEKLNCGPSQSKWV